jgi:hypothetical protein
MSDPKSASHWGLHSAPERTPIYAKEDVVRKTPLRALTAEEQAQVASFKDIAQEWLDLIDTLPLTRELAVAKTNVEQALMWTVKGITS